MFSWLVSLFLTHQRPHRLLFLYSTTVDRFLRTLPRISSFARLCQHPQIVLTLQLGCCNPTQCKKLLQLKKNLFDQSAVQF
jgi:hypothetical protein